MVASPSCCGQLTRHIQCIVTTVLRTLRVKLTVALGGSTVETITRPEGGIRTFFVYHALCIVYIGIYVAVKVGDRTS